MQPRHRAVPFAALLLSLFVALGAVTSTRPTTAAAPPVQPPGNAWTVEADPLATFHLNLRDADEHARLSTLLLASDLSPARDPEQATITVSDHELRNAQTIATHYWAVVAHQRSDVHNLSAKAVRAAASGWATDWKQLGGQARALTLYVPREYEHEIGNALRTSLTPTAVVLPLTEIIEAVAVDAGGIALIPATLLAPGVLGLVVDDYDPYRDPASASPLQTRRWIQRAPYAPLGFPDLAAAWQAPAQFDPVGLLATGDVVPTRCTGERLEALGDYNLMFDGTRHLIAAADIAIMPLEISLTSVGGPTPCTRTFMLQGSPLAAATFATAGFDVVTTAGNHAGDCWLNCPRHRAFRDTAANLDAAGLPHTGTGENRAEATTPVVLERQGLRFAFLAYDDIAHYFAATETEIGSATYDPDTLADDVQQAAALVDHVVISFSWGTEYTANPTRRQREAARIAADAGASLVVGNHPHWVQAVEQIGETVVFYALGNFVFDQSWSIPTTQGFIAEVGFDVDRVLGFRLRPVVIQDVHRPDLVDPAREGAAILQRAWAASDRLQPRS